MNAEAIINSNNNRVALMGSAGKDNALGRAIATAEIDEAPRSPWGPER
jgi:hypothetical protein